MLLSDKVFYLCGCPCVRRQITSCSPNNCHDFVTIPLSWGYQKLLPSAHLDAPWANPARAVARNGSS
jgi:hypothetical protein